MWDAATGEQIGQSLKHGDAVNSAAFSPNGNHVVTASADNTARVWDAATGKQIGQSLKHDAAVKSAIFWPDGNRVVTASADKTAKVWDAATGKQIGQPLERDDPVNSAAFSPDGSRVVTASADKTARVWDAATGEQIGQPLKHGAGHRPAAKARCRGSQRRIQPRWLSCGDRVSGQDHERVSGWTTSRSKHHSDGMQDSTRQSYRKPFNSLWHYRRRPDLHGGAPHPIPRA